MTFTRGLSRIFPGFGQPQVITTNTRNNVALVDGANTITIPASGSWSPTISAGRWRIKVYNGAGTTPAVTKVTVTGTDTTTTETFGTFYADTSLALSSTAWLDWIGSFLSELNLTSMSIIVTLSGTSETATGDAEVIGTI